MSGVYFISDLHLGHKNIINMREFETVENHDEFVFNKIMEVSGKRSKLFLLGDTCFSKDSFHYIEKMARAFNKIDMVIGNHDFERKGCPSHRDYLALGIELHGMIKYKEFWLTHPPIHPMELRGKHNIHGHTHHNHYDSERYTNVSAEHIFYEPKNLDLLRQEIYLREDLEPIHVDTNSRLFNSFYFIPVPNENIIEVITKETAENYVGKYYKKEDDARFAHFLNYGDKWKK